MRYAKLAVILLVLLAACALGAMAKSSAEYQPRGLYVYDYPDRIPLDAELGINALLWRQDVKNGYETVVVFLPEKKGTEQENIEAMGAWFDANGVGKKEEGNGVAIFVYPDNSVYGMIGAGHDAIAVPLLTDAGQKALKNMDDDPVLSILNLLNLLAVQLDDPTVTTEEDGLGKKLLDNFDIVAACVAFFAGLYLLWNQRDGFQWEDFRGPVIVFVIAIIVAGSFGVISQATQDVETQYGVILEDHPGSYMITEDHSYTDSEGHYHHQTDTHTIYTNDAKLTSYDYRPYVYHFESRDFASAWEYRPGVPVRLQVGVKNYALYSASGFSANSGGKTDWYGCWMRYANTTGAKA